MGLNSWAAFAGTPSDAQIAGDIAMKESEVNAVPKTLRANGLEIVAIHHHMLGTQPQIIFLHYWDRDPAEKLATGFRATLDTLGLGPSPPLPKCFFSRNSRQHSLIPLSSYATLLKTSKFIQTEGTTFLFS
jgi:hypothetical protein